MYSYPEFTVQVRATIEHFATSNNFKLKAVFGNYKVIYRNTTWELKFICEYGIVDIYLINRSDNIEIHFSSLLEFWFPESHYYKEFGNYIYGSRSNIKWLIQGLDYHFRDFEKQYEPKISDYVKFIKLESELIRYMHAKGSELLKQKFNDNTDDWKEIAISEMKKNPS